jgi:hypothetical protein
LEPFCLRPHEQEAVRFSGNFAFHRAAQRTAERLNTLLILLVILLAANFRSSASSWVPAEPQGMAVFAQHRHDSPQSA